MDIRTAPDNANGVMLERLDARFCLYCAAEHNVRAGNLVSQICRAPTGCVRPLGVEATPDIPARAVPLRLRERRGGCAHGGILHPWTASGKGEPCALKSDQRAAQRHNRRYGHFVIGVTHIREASEAEVRRLIEKA